MNVPISRTATLNPKALSLAVLYGPLGILITYKNVKNRSHQPKKDMLRSSGTYSEVLVGVLLSPVPPSEKFCSILRNPLFGDVNPEVKSRGGSFISLKGHSRGHCWSQDTKSIGRSGHGFIYSESLPQSIYAMNLTYIQTCILSPFWKNTSLHTYPAP